MVEILRVFETGSEVGVRGNAWRDNVRGDASSADGLDQQRRIAADLFKKFALQGPPG